MRISDWSSDVCSSDLVVMGVFRPLRPSRESVGTEQRHEEPLAEEIVEPRYRQHDEAGCGHPVDEALEDVEAQDRAAGFMVPLHPDRPTEEVECSEQEDHAEDHDAADPGQRTFVEGAVIASLRML